jgi:hypothetical protein
MATPTQIIPPPRANRSANNLPPSNSQAQLALDEAQKLLGENNTDKNTLPEPIPFDIIGFTYWLRQAALIVAALAGGLAFLAARMSERTWLECAFCSCAAALVAGAVSTSFARVILSQLSPAKTSDVKSSGAKP